MACTFQYSTCPTPGTRLNPFITRPLINIDRTHTKLIDIYTFIVVCIRNCRVQHLSNDPGRLFLTKYKQIYCLPYRQASNLVSNQSRFLWRNPGKFEFRCYIHQKSTLFLCLPIPSMTFKHAGWGELPKFMTHHILCNKNRNVLTPVMYCDSKTNHIRNDHRAP
ncbi:MAG: hypothetical protein BECKG1743D_GA0114223_1000417 [Candidatus Kentron sp. G]|nr:MAG: hypothetical protein BECKG1743F_GA0114225_100027 [Candidatus Kentron sp. G]VFM95503.1 MAG: hypothetical protein BECKG1743E_GA0114224_1000519 [Candidatus Kentron sp. G]VFM97154.1 MAG: hypothetical protein BECKG1743D_GA0114223_1000417 [Candidatus Kentron sp. G]